MSKRLLILALSLLIKATFAQTLALKNSSINAFGSTQNSSTGITLLHSAGQSSLIGYSKGTSNTVHLRQGFQQPIILGLQLKSQLPEIVIYPNPTTRFVNIDMNNGDRAIWQLNIVSTNGTILKSQLLNTVTTTIDLDDFAQGVYTVIIKTQNNNLQITRLLFKK